MKSIEQFTHGQLKKKSVMKLDNIGFSGNKEENSHIQSMQIHSEFGCKMELQTSEERNRLLKFVIKCVNVTPNGRLRQIYGDPST